ncbi:hypothetical protein [Flavobacterium sp.]|jgi:hypothetical protein|uniref:hypothetical protein n=1 Tax=Flavobacterium sp. TaxID=239 RepID=UPI0022C3781E|nr:hypothetical protein [Flavobacterium sp.]MCZ8144135.1 hypothetical protein [Flavobacterium sp.]MCZ8366244.1 hypothetical protein [Flavobacterium sp.]
MKHFNFPPGIKKVAFFHSHVNWPSHLETELELMHYFDAQTEVLSYQCNDVLQRCDGNPHRDLYYCSKCISKRLKGLQLMRRPFRSIPIQLMGDKLSLDLDLSIEEFKKMCHHNFDVGYAVLSSVVSIYRDAYPTLRKYASDFQDFYANSIQLYDFFIQSFSKEQPDLVVIFNGRFAYTRALLRACEAMNIPFYTHERGADPTKFMMYPKALPHDMKLYNSIMLEAWNDDSVSLTEKTAIAEKYYQDRMAGKSQSWFSFVANQEKEKLPEQWNPNHYNIGIFLSSEDEFIAIGNTWEAGLFSNQLVGIQQLFEKLPRKENCHFYIRIHPNSKQSVDFIRNLKALENDAVTVILPDSKYSTYKLMMEVDKVISFGSTVGIEATFWGKTSVGLGQSFYTALEAVYFPTSIDMAIQYIDDDSLVPIAKERALPYAYHLATFGYAFQTYKGESIMVGSFNGTDLNTVRGIKNTFFNNAIRRWGWFGRKLYNLEFKLRYNYLKNKSTYGA